MADFTCRIALNDYAKLVDLSADPYTLAKDFVPPTASQMPIMGASSALNPYGGTDFAGVASENFEFSFSIHIKGSSNADIELSLKDINEILSEVGNKSNPLYLEIRPKGIVPFYPALGQWNGPKRLEIVFGFAQKSEYYGTGNMREALQPNCTITLDLKPFPVGLEQICARGRLGVVPDFYGHPMKRVRGISILPALTNYFTDPIIQNPATQWTFDAGLTYNLNYDKRFIVFERLSTYVHSNAANLDMYANVTLTAATYSIVFLAKKRDGSAISSADCQAIYDNAGVTTTFYSLGDGWYLGFGTFTGSTLSKMAGIRFQANVEVFLGGAALYLATIPYHIGYGGLDGWNWSGTPHASTSSCSAGAIGWYWNDIINPIQGTITLTWIPPANSSAMTGAEYDLLDTSTVTWKLYWDGSAGRFKFVDNAAHTTQSAVVTYSAFTPLVIHLVWGAGQAQIYINGAASGSAGTYSIPVAGGEQIYLGSDAIYGSVCSGGVYTQLTTYLLPFTATQVTNDHANISPLAAARERIDWIFYQHCDEPDATVYSVNDSTYNNWCSFNGVPGDAPAQTRLKLYCSGSDSFGASYLGGCFLSLLPTPPSRPIGNYAMQNYMYSEQQGTADANSSGGEYKTTASIGSTPVAFDPASTLDFGKKIWDVLSGREFAFLMRVKDSVGANLLARVGYKFGSDDAVYSEWVPLTTSTTNFWARLTRKVVFKDVRSYFEGLNVQPLFSTSGKFTLEFKYSTGTGSVSLDFYCFVVSPTLRIWSTSASSSLTGLLYDSKYHKAAGVGNSYDFKSDLVYVEGGTRFEFLPDQINYVISIPADIKRSGLGQVTASKWLQYNRVSVIPRYLMT